MNGRSERLFVWLWRINGVLIFLIATVGLAGILILVFNMVRSSRDRPDQQLARVGGTDLGALDHQTSRESVLVFYVSKGAARVLDLDLAHRRVRSDEPISTQQ